MTDSSSDNWADKKVFTTGEAAKVCGVSQQTIIRCFDSGRLTGFRVPGSKFRRIPRDELLRFMAENGVPSDAIEGKTRRVLLVDDDPQILSVMQEVLGDDGRFELEAASTGYDAGLATERFKPHVIVLDYLLPDINGNQVIARIREQDHLSGVRILCVSGVVRQSEVDALLRAGADGFLRKPFDIDDLVARIAQLAGLDARPGGKSPGNGARKDAGGAH